MSEYEDDMLFDSEMEEMSDKEENDPDVRSENLYFEAKDVATQDLDSGLNSFQSVLDIDINKTRWGFKSLKCIIKIYFNISKHDQVSYYFNKLLTEYAALLIEKEKAINNLLDFVQSSPNISSMYAQALKQYELNGNKKAMLRLELRLAKVLFDNKNFTELEKILSKMHENCLLPDGTDDPSKGNQLMEIYALKISMYSACGNHSKLKELHQLALETKGLCNPRIAGVIYECGGKMHMRDQNWQAANTDFFEAFKNYDDAGVRTQSCQCLKYLVISNMLNGSDINPFHEQRARSYQNNYEIQVMISLIDAYQKYNISAFEKCVKLNRQVIIDDPFIADYISEIIKKLRIGALMELVKPYSQITLQFLTKELNMEFEELEILLIELILDGKIKGKVNQVEQSLKLDRGTTSNVNKLKAINRVIINLHDLNNAVFRMLN